jgi:hypothetical protein
MLLVPLRCTVAFWLNPLVQSALVKGACPKRSSNRPIQFSRVPRRSYQHFCRCGRTLDTRLEELGGARLAPRADINREDFAAIDAWVADVLAALPSLQLKTVAELGGAAALAAPAAEGGGAHVKR